MTSESRQPFERTYDPQGNLVSAIEPEPGAVRITQRNRDGSYSQRVHHNILPINQEWRVISVPLHPIGMLKPHYNVRKKQ
jgi:hypothetical protein